MVTVWETDCVALLSLEVYIQCKTEKVVKSRKGLYDSLYFMNLIYEKHNIQAVVEYIPTGSK